MPTSVAISMVAWGLQNNRATVAARVTSTDLLSKFVTLCQRTNDFKVRLYPPGPLD